MIISELMTHLGEHYDTFGDLEVFVNGIPILNCTVLPIDTNPDSKSEVIVLYKNVLLLTTE